MELFQVLKYLICRKCGYVRNYFFGGRSFSGISYLNYKTLEFFLFGLLIKYNQLLIKFNGNVNYKFGLLFGEKGIILDYSKIVLSDFKKVFNGGFKKEKGMFENLLGFDFVGS